MSEYWKSTPKYWCKHCKTFVRDTKLEKSNHEATAKHQGNIKRFIRDMHRGHEREERDKDRAKNEVERLNGVVSGNPSNAKHGMQWGRPNALPVTSQLQEATPAERKAQLIRLADMGVAVPEEFRREMAMAGDWQTVAERPVWKGVKKEDVPDDFKDFKPDPTLNIGVRKRKVEDQDGEGGDSIATTTRKGWGSAVRQYPGSTGTGNDDLEDLLSNAAPLPQQTLENEGSTEMPEPEIEQNRDPNDSLTAGDCRQGELQVTRPLKKEESHEVVLGNLPSHEVLPDAAVKQEPNSAQPAIVFKKRKAKVSTRP
ncbi:MAG: hypothetical protein Q9220_001153 [cf. Caloplaca sp. 1 TL-2023]